MKSKRLLAIFLVLTMLVSLMPMSFAEDVVEEAVEEEFVIEEEAEEVVREEAPEEEADPEEEYILEDAQTFEDRDALPYVTFTGEVGSTTSEVQVTAKFKEEDADHKYWWYVDEAGLAAAVAGVKETNLEDGSHIGEHVTAWSVDCSVPFKAPYANVEAMTVKATAWAKDTFAVTYAVEPNTAVFTAKLPDDGVVTYGTALVMKKGTTTLKKADLQVEGYKLEFFLSNDPTHAKTYEDIITPGYITADTQITLKYTIQQHTVKFVYNDGEPVVYPIEFPVTHGETISTDAYTHVPEKAGADPAKFKWVPSVEGYTTESEILEDVTFTATWGTEQVTVNFYGAGEQPEIAKTEKINKGGKVAYYELPVTEGTLTGWCEKGETTPFDFNTQIQKDTNLYPIISTGTFVTVSFELNGGKPDAKYNDKKVAPGSTIAEPDDPTKFGYSFDCWKVQKVGGWEEFKFDTPIEKDTVLKAFWNVNTYKLVIDTTGIGEETWTYGAKVFTAETTDTTVESEEYVVGLSFTPKQLTAALGALEPREFKAYYDYQVVDANGEPAFNPDGSKKMADVPWDVNKPKELDETMVFTPAGDNTFALTLYPVLDTAKWVVKFETTYGTVNSVDKPYYPEDPEANMKLGVPTTPGEDGVALQENSVFDADSLKEPVEFDKFLEGWYVKPATGDPDWSASSRWNFNDPVTGHMTLVAHWVALNDVTFTLNHDKKSDAVPAVADAVWDNGLNPAPVEEVVTKKIPTGMSFKKMADLVALNKDLVTKVNNLEVLGENYFVLPTATRLGYKDLSWVGASGEPIELTTTINSATTVYSKWAEDNWTVSFDTSGGTPATIPAITVGNGKTIDVDDKPEDPVKDGYVFDKWVYYVKGNPEEFIFDDDEVEHPTVVNKDFNLKATWLKAVAKIDTTPYASLKDALVAAKANDTIVLLSDISLDAKLPVSKDVKFAFGSYEVDAGTYEIEVTDATLTVVSGTFNGGIFTTIDGEDEDAVVGKIKIQGGTFLGTQFSKADTWADFTVTGGKFDADAARPINAADNVAAILDDGNKLAVVTSDGFYTLVPAVTITFDHTPVEYDGSNNKIVVIGKGETPAHALAEMVAINPAYKTTAEWIASPEDPDNVYEFVEWKLGSSKFDLNTAYTGTPVAITVKADWAQVATLVLTVYNDGYEDPAFPEISDKFTVKKKLVDNKATFTTADFEDWDYAEIIARHNAKADTKYPDVFEYWAEGDNKVDFEQGYTVDGANVKNVQAKMMAKLVFEADKSSAPTVIQANNADTLAKYMSSSSWPAVPKGSDSWVYKNIEKNPAPDARDKIAEKLENGVVEFVPIYAQKTTWDVYDVKPEDGWTLKDGTVKFAGTADAPIVLEFNSNEKTLDKATFDLTVKIEAPSDNKVYQVQMSGPWKDIAAADWDENPSISGNRVYTFKNTLTLADIKAAADSKTTLTFPLKFREKGATETCAEFNVAFEPRFVKFDDIKVANKPVVAFRIADYKYKFAVNFQLDGGTMDGITPIVADFGTPFVFNDDYLPKKDDGNYEFEYWSGVNTWENNEEYRFRFNKTGNRWEKYDPKEKKWSTEEVKTFNITDDITLTASWKVAPITVEIDDGHGSVVTDVTTYTLADSIYSIALPAENPGDHEVFKQYEWYNNIKQEGLEDIIGWVKFAPTKDVTIGEWMTGLNAGKVLKIRAKYDPVLVMTFVTSGEEPLTFKVAENTTIKNFYNSNKEAIQAAQKEINGFQYWTDEDPKYWPKDDAPAPFNFTSDTPITADNTLYPYANVVVVGFVVAEGTKAIEKAVATGSKVADVLKAAPTIEDKGFEGWFDENGKNFETYASSWSLNEPMLLTAHYLPKVTVTFKDSDGKVLAEEAMSNGSSAADVLAKAPVIKDDNFDGWYNGEVKFTSEIVGFELTKPLELTAHYFAAPTISPALNLHDTIGIKFYVIPPEGMDPANVKVNVSYTSKYQTVNKDYELGDLTPNKNGEYTIPGVDCASDEMSDTLTLTIVRKDTNKAIFTQDYTIASIANIWLNDGQHTSYVGLLKAMLQYGDKAQVQFNNNADKHITPEGAPKLVAIPDSFAPGTDPTTLAEYIEYCQFAINLETAVGMNIYIKPKSGITIDDVKVTVTDKQGNPVATSAPAMVSGEIKVMVPGLYPEQLLSDYNITVTVKGMAATYVRSVMSCAYTLQQKGKAVELVEALYQYALAADEIW